jgi:hypothetical protein
MKNKPRKLRTAIPHRPPGEGTAQPSAGEPPAPGRGRWWWPWAVALLAIALTAGVTGALFEFILSGQVPPELVGRWRVVGGEMTGATMEFRRDGTMVGKFTAAGKEGLIEGQGAGDRQDAAHHDGQPVHRASGNRGPGHHPLDGHRVRGR